MKHCLNCMEMISDELTVCPHCGYDSEETIERLDQLKPGSMLKDRFLIGNPLGRGGFGITYIAWDTSLARKVAIKEYLPRGLALRESGNTTVAYDEETEEAFLRGVDKTIEESRKLAGFSDLESVVNVYDCFKENGTAYIVMEVLKGENVKEKIKREDKISFDETLKIITPVLKTLAAVHKTGIIHRDISPDNIFLCDNGKVKLLDFGSARIADNADERSRSIVLKHGYAPKEQYTSKGKQGPYTDIYALSATVYKMLTGITPVDSLERISDEDELQDISELVKIPSTAAKAIMQGMAVNASDRIQSADELLEKLTAKENEKNSSYYDAEETVTLYVPGMSAGALPDEPVFASEIKPAKDLNKLVSHSKAKTEPEVKPEIKPETEPKKDYEDISSTSPKGKADNSGLIKKILAAAACVALIASGIILIPKAVKNAKAEKEAQTDNDEEITEIATTLSTTLAEIISDITTHDTETETKATEKTTQSKTEKETTLNLNSLSSAYIKTKDADSKVNLRESASASSKSLASLASGTEVKIIEKSGDWYKVAVGGKTGYIKSDYISDKKAVPFSTGYVKGGVYYNEWANLKFNIPNGWKEPQENDNKGIEGYLGGYGVQNQDENEEIAVHFFKGNLQNVIQRLGFDWNKRTTGALASQPYNYYDNDDPHLLYTIHTREFFKQIDEYTIVVLVSSYDESHIESLAALFSKIS